MGFCTAFRNIMSRTMENPHASAILCETQVVKKIKEDKAAFKAKKEASMQQKALKDRGHEKPDITQKAFEMRMRKAATLGVVRLFNAVKDFQLRGQEDTAAVGSKVPIKRRSKEIAVSTQASFQKELNKERGPKRARRSETTRDTNRPGVISVSAGINPN